MAEVEKVVLSRKLNKGLRIELLFRIKQKNFVL